MSAFQALLAQHVPRYRLKRCRIPACLTATAPNGLAPDADGLLLLDLVVRDGRIAALEPPGLNETADDAAIDLRGRMIWPAFVELHCHLDKGHVVPRATNADGSFTSGRIGTAADVRHWSYDDIRTRMEFGLRCAYAHGVAAVRTHIDSYEGQAELSWRVFRDLRDAWSGRIALQAVGLVALDAYRTDYGLRLADLVADSGGVLGGVTRAHQQDHVGLLDDTADLLDTALSIASSRGLDVDLHVDQSSDLTSFALPLVAEAVMRNSFEGRVVCSHCVNLALQPPDVAQRAIDLCRMAGLAITSLPTPMMYLQDRAPGRTPRWRGVTLVNELRAAGVPVAIGGDNCRDAFFPYGDHDVLDTFRQAVHVLHLDHPFGDAPAMVTAVPAEIARFSGCGRIHVGGPARFTIFNARSFNELMCRPQSDRIVIERGRRVTARLPSYEELDGPLGLSDTGTATKAPPAPVNLTVEGDHA